MYAWLHLGVHLDVISVNLPVAQLMVFILYMYTYMYMYIVFV